MTTFKNMPLPLRSIVYLGIFVVLFGCALSNEGKVDFRRTDVTRSACLTLERSGMASFRAEVKKILAYKVSVSNGGVYHFSFRYINEGPSTVLIYLDGERHAAKRIQLDGVRNVWSWMDTPLSVGRLPVGTRSVYVMHSGGKLKIDRLMLTMDAALFPKKESAGPPESQKSANNVFQETAGKVVIEAENYTELTNAGQCARWEVGSKNAYYSGSGYVEAFDRPPVYQTFAVKNFSLSGGAESSFEVGDALSLHLRSAYIKAFSENKVVPYLNKIFTRQWRKVNGEIAIVANAFEETEGRELSFEDMRAGRVVFYSEDVHEGQFLNFNNMPIYGPLNYKGAPFAFRIAIFELDVISEQVKAMLTTLAQAGAMAYPPASPVLEILNGLGNTFMDGDQTDTEFRYTMVLDPKGGSKRVNHFALEVGNYALVRTEDRDEEIPWEKLVLDENSGALYILDPAGRPQPYKENTYLIVEVNKNVGYIGVELAQNNFGDLIAVLEQQDRSRAASWESTADAFKKVAIQRKRIVNFSRAKAILEQIGPESTLSRYEKPPLAEELFIMIANSVGDDGKVSELEALKSGETYDLSRGQVDYILRRIHVLAGERVKNYTDYQKLDLSRIVEGFQEKIVAGVRKVPVDATRQEILNLVTPID